MTKEDATALAHKRANACQGSWLVVKCEDGSYTALRELSTYWHAAKGANIVERVSGRIPS
jgi:hypothetical protein